MGMKYKYEYNKQNTPLLHVSKNIGTGRGRGGTQHHSEGKYGNEVQLSTINKIHHFFKILFEILFMIPHNIVSYWTTLYQIVLH